MYGYIYKTVNLLSNKIYVGKHVGEFDPEYKGSGRYINNAMNKYGKDNFSVKLIDIADGLHELNAKEIFWIQFYKDQGFIMYNISKGGDGGDTFADLTLEDRQTRIEKLRKNSYFAKLSPEQSSEIHKKGWDTRRKNGNDKLSESQIESLRQANIGRKIPQEVIDKRTKTRMESGYRHSQETIEKIRQSNLGKKRSEEVCRNISLSRQGKGVGSDNPFYGKHHTDAVKQHISKCNKLGICGGKGRIWVNNDTCNKRIKPEELSYYESLGYVQGRLPFKKKEDKVNEFSSKIQA